MNLFICLLSYTMITFVIVTRILKITNCGEYPNIYKSNNGIIWPIMFATLLFLFSYFIVGIKDNLEGDRLNYYQDFALGRSTGYVAFVFLTKLIHSQTGNYLFYLSFMVALCSFIIFFALRLSDKIGKYAILFLMISYIFFKMFTELKQSPVNAMAALIFVLLIEHKNKWTTLLSIILIIISCGFHSTAFILIPLFFLLCINSIKGKKTIFIIIALICSVIFMEPILRIIANTIGSVIPTLRSTILAYVSEGSLHNSDGESLVMAAVKGFPYYFLLFAGLLERRNHIDDEYYDKYLILTALGAFFSVTTIFSYWYSRLSLLFILPMAIFFQYVMERASRNNRLVYCTVILGSLLLFTTRSVCLIYINYGGY